MKIIYAFFTNFSKYFYSYYWITFIHLLFCHFKWLITQIVYFLQKMNWWVTAFIKSLLFYSMVSYHFLSVLIDNYFWQLILFLLLKVRLMQRQCIFTPLFQLYRVIFWNYYRLIYLWIKTSFIVFEHCLTALHTFSNVNLWVFSVVNLWWLFRRYIETLWKLFYFNFILFINKNRQWLVLRDDIFFLNLMRW